MLQPPGHRDLLKDEVLSSQGNDIGVTHLCPREHQELRIRDGRGKDKDKDKQQCYRYKQQQVPIGD